jgi:hypothetical protein
MTENKNPTNPTSDILPGPGIQGVPMRTIEDHELRGAVVLASSLLDLQDLVEELREERVAYAKLTDCLVQILKAFNDLYLELTDESEHRKFLSKAILRAERDVARTRLPTWFWRPEPGKSLDEMLTWRAKFLILRQKALPDDLWDLLKEFTEDYAKNPVSDEQLQGIIRSVQAGKEG